MAITLPTQYKYIELADEINRNITNQEFVGAIDIVASIYDTEEVYHYKKDDTTGVVLYKALTIVDQTEVEGATQTDKAQSVYAGFLYGAIGYETTTEEGRANLTELLVNGKESITLINYDTDEDGTDDAVITLINNSYVYFELPKELGSITSLDFKDNKGKSYLKIDEGLNLNFDNQFFNGIEEFISVYNNYPNDSNKNEKLQELLDGFLLLDDTFKQGGDYYETAVNNASKKSVTFVAIYFIVVYVFYDCLLGQRFIIGLILKIYRKIKYKGKEIPKTNTEEVYGKDYYTQLTYKIIVPDDADVTATIKYHNETDSLEMVFSKDKNYTVVKRVHAGKYQNAWLECDDYEAINLPKILQVRGYKMLVEVTLQKKKKI